MQKNPGNIKTYLGQKNFLQYFLTPSPNDLQKHLISFPAIILRRVKTLSPPLHQPMIEIGVNSLRCRLTIIPTFIKFYFWFIEMDVKRE